MIRDFRSGFRQFIHKPFFSSLIVLLVATGIGANILIFGFIDTLLLKPLPVRNPENLWMLGSIHPHQTEPSHDFTYSQVEELQGYPNLFTAVTAEQIFGSAAAYPSKDDSGLSRLVMTQMVAPNYFQEMDVHPVLGRLLDHNDAKTTTDIPVVISYQFWQSRYNGRADIVGQTIRIKEFPFSIAGVLPRDFHSIDIERAPDVRLPISAAIPLHGQAVNDSRGDQYHEGFRVFARLRKGVSPAEIEPLAGPRIRKALCDEFMVVNASLSRPYPPAEVSSFLDWLNSGHLTLVPIGQGLSGLRTQFAYALQLLMAGVIVLLLTVSANVMGLLLARGEERRKDLALRLSIGAGRWRLLRQLMVENLCLAIPGAVLGWILAFVLAPHLMAILPPVRSVDQYATPQILSVTPDLRILLFAWLAILVSICFFGLFPAWRATRLDFSAELKGASALRSQSMAALVPVSIQVALSMLLLTAGGVMLRTYWSLEHLNPGFDRNHVVGFTLGMKDAGYTKPQARAYLTELQQRIKGMGGVRSVSYSFLGLMRGSGQKRTVTIPRANQASSVFLNMDALGVSPDYFDTLGIPLLEGRLLSEQDREAKPERVVLNRAMAKIFFPNTDPVGHLLISGTDGSKPPAYQVVGVVETSKYLSMQEPTPATLYLLVDDEDYSAVVYVRTAGKPTDVIRPVQEQIRRMGGGVTLREAQTLDQDIQNSLWQERLVAALACFFSFVALLLAGIGLYGTLAYAVTRRRRELGIRIAVGAQIRHVLGTVCGKMLLAVSAGIVVGWVASALALRFARSFLFEVQPFDGLSFAGATLAVLLCAGIAALVPAWRAIRTNASSSLREQ